MRDHDEDPAVQAELDAAQVVLNEDRQNRQDLLLLKHLPQVLAELRAVEDAGERVRFEIGKAQIAVCERLSRIARRDLAEQPH